MNVEATEEEVEIELNEAEPLFLRGQASAVIPPPPSPRAAWTNAPQTRPLVAQTKASVAMSPIKVVKNPDGSLQRAAMTQSALAKARVLLLWRTRGTALWLRSLLPCSLLLCSRPRGRSVASCASLSSAP